jgi:hypothetical protein
MFPHVTRVTDISQEVRIVLSSLKMTTFLSGNVSVAEDIHLINYFLPLSIRTGYEALSPSLSLSLSYSGSHPSIAIIITFLNKKYFYFGFRKITTDLQDHARTKSYALLYSFYDLVLNMSGHLNF